MTGLVELYEQRRAALAKAEERLRSMLMHTVETIEDKTLVRAELRKGRTKDLESLERKARDRGWDAEEALTRCGDLVGGRVVCNNIEDVYRFAELLKEQLPWMEGTFELQDKIKDPDAGGYRALHVTFRLDVGEFIAPDLVSCEVQIRSRLQDAWAELSHDDIYKHPELPEDLRARGEDLAEMLSAADRIASDIRARVARQIVPPEERPNLERVSSEGLAFVFAEAFGRSSPDYIVRQGLNVCRDLDITAIERLPEILGREDFRDKLDKAFRAIMGVPISNEDIFIGAVYALAKGDGEALKQVRRTARREWREIEQIARGEVLSELPESSDELVEELRAGRIQVMEVADFLGGKTECAVCSTDLIDPFGFEEGVSYHYDHDFEGDVQGALYDLDLPLVDLNDPTLCPYHAHVLAKDD